MMFPMFRLIMVLIQKILAGMDHSRVCQDALIKIPAEMKSNWQSGARTLWKCML
jgi:hypothetical protein